MAEDTTTQAPPQLTPQQFAGKLKAKYPQYKDVDDNELVQKIVAKYPDYKSQINFDSQKKNPVQTVGVSTSHPSSNGGLIALVSPQSGRLPNPTAPTQQSNPVEQAGIHKLDAIANTQAHIGQVKQALYPKQLRPDVKAMYDKMPKDQQQDFIKSPEFNLTQLDDLKNMTPDDMKHWQYMNETKMGKSLGVAAYLGRQATKGSLAVLKGVSHLANHAFNNGAQAQLGDMATAGVFDTADKHTNMGLTKGDIKNAESGTIESGAGQIAYALPAILGGEATGATKAVFGLQGVGNAVTELEDAEKNGTKVSPLVKQVYPLASGMLNGYLMGDVGETMFAKLPNSVRSGIARNLVIDAVKDAAGKDITPEILQSAAKKFMGNVKQRGIGYLKNYARTTADLSVLNSANWALQKGADSVSDKPIFNNNDFVGGIGQAAKSAIGFALPGAFTKLLPYSEGKDQITQEIYNKPTDENVASIKQQITDHAEKQGWTPQETQQTLDHVDKIHSAVKQLPDNIAPEKRGQAVDLLMSKNDLQGQLDELAKVKESLDPALKDITSPNEQLITDKIDQANDKLRSIVTGDRTTYSKGVGEEEGKFFKTTAGQREEITPSRYELENLERTSKQQNNENSNEKNGEESSQEESSQSSSENGSSEEDGLGKENDVKQGGDEPPAVETNGSGNKEVISSDQANAIYPIQRDRMKSVDGVKSSVNSLIDNDQIYRSIITSIPVDVMHDFIGKKLSTEDILSDKNVFKDALSRNSKLDIFPNVRDALIDATTGVGTKLFNALSAGRYEEFNSTVKALNLNLSEVVRLLALNDRKGLSMEDINSVFRKAIPGTVFGDKSSIGLNDISSPTVFTDILHDPNIRKNNQKASNSDSPVGAEKGEKPRFKIKGNEITPLPPKEHAELESHLLADGVTIQDLQDEQQERNSTSNEPQKTGIDAEAIQQPENDGAGNDGEHSTGERPENGKGSGEAKQNETGIRNEDVAGERNANVERERKTFAQIDKEGKRLVDEHEIEPNQLAEDIVSGKKKSVTAEEEAALLYHKTRLNNRQNAILADTNPENNTANQAEYAKNEDALEQNRKATEIAGNVAGRSLAYRRQLMKSDYSLATLLRRAKLFNGGEDVSPEVKAKLEERSRRIAALEKQLEDREEQIRRLQEKAVVTEVKSADEQDAKKNKREITKSKLRKEREELVAELHTIARSAMKSAGANKIPVEMLAPLAKLARNYVLDGINTIGGVADKIYNEHIKDKIDGIGRDDIEAAIKDGFDKFLSEKNADRLAGAKKRQLTKLTALREGNYEKRTYAKIQVDNDYLKIRAEINREQAKVNKQMDDIINSKKSIGRKITDFAVKYGRQAKLASVTVLGKLAAAGLSTVSLKPITEGIGGGISKLLPRIAAKSTIEGGTDFKGLAKSYAKAVTQGMKDAYDEMNIKAGGKSDLSSLYGKAGQLPAEAAEFFGHVHSAIKAPVKRFIFEQSYSKRIAKQMAAGMDITDPVIDAQNRLASYKDAERAIFMGDNALSEAYESIIGKFEKTDESKSGLYLRKNSAALARILLPFVKVPTNIVLSTGRYAFGLIPGLGKLAQVGSAEAAKRLGAEKLANALGNGVEGLKPEEADLILRNLKHGSIGGAALALGFLNPKAIGGYYQHGEKRKAGDVGAGQFKIFGDKIPMWLTEHPIFQAMQIGATYRRLLDSHIKKEDKIETATLGTLSGISSNIPLAGEAKNIFDALGSSNKFTKFTSNTVKGEVEPAMLQQLAQITDTKDGSAFTFKSDNQVKRKPNNKHGLGRYLKEDLETGVPGLREKVGK